MANKSKLTKEMKSKIEQVAALDGSVREMAVYCGVSHQTIYNWLQEDKELFDTVERLRARPILKARETVVKRLTDSYGNAMDYLKRNRHTREEFGDNLDITTKNRAIDTLSELTDDQLRELTKGSGEGVS